MTSVRRSVGRRSSPRRRGRPGGDHGPFRSHVSVATAALVLVVPVVIGVVIGGFPAGAAAVVAGFFVYDLVFIPPTAL